MKCLELKPLLRAELDANIFNLLKGLEEKMADSLPGLVQAIKTKLPLLLRILEKKLGRPATSAAAGRRSCGATSSGRRWWRW